MERLAATYGNVGRALLVLGVADGAVLLDDHSPAAVAVTHASGPAVVLGEEALGVTEHKLMFILALIMLIIMP